VFIASSISADQELLIEKSWFFDPDLEVLERYGNWIRRIDNNLGRWQRGDYSKPPKGRHTIEEWNDLRKLYDYTCPCCGRTEKETGKQLTRDHIVPICFRRRYNIPRLDDIGNIQPLCDNCNRKKGDRVILYPRSNNGHIATMHR